jgi:hypothetical protein
MAAGVAQPGSSPSYSEQQFTSGVEVTKEEGHAKEEDRRCTA